MQREDKPLLLRRRPAIAAMPVKRDGGEGEELVIGEALGGWGLGG